MKKIVFIILTVFTLQANASLSGWFEKTANKVIGLNTSIAEVNELLYVYDEGLKLFRPSVTFKKVTGKLTNNSKEDTIKTVVFSYEILECVTKNNCITIDEDEERWHTNIPPGQTRYFDHLIAYRKGNSTKDIYFRQTIKYLFPYDNM